jgi:TonB family protein
MQWQYNMGLRTDTCISWNKEGNISEVSVTDSAGSGICQLFYGNGQLKESGRLVNGLRSGKWMVKNEDGSPLMELQFVNDSLTQTICLDNNGAPVQGECVYERAPEFPGGLNGWRRFLEAKLRYPDDAIRNNIQGVVKVKFVVEKDGALSNLEIMSSPNESLSREVLRLMKSGPKWVPAMQYNKPVKYYHIQAVTFRLQ